MSDLPISGVVDQARAPKLLVAGVGNVLKSDDAFGVTVVNEILQSGFQHPEVTVMETGIGGISMIQELMLPYQGLVIVDAYQGGNAPGSLSVLEPTVEKMEMDIHETRDYFADTHYATPARALQFLKSIQRLPDFLRIVGCEPENVDEYTMRMSNAVSSAIPQAVAMVLEIIDNFLNPAAPAGAAPTQ